MVVKSIWASWDKLNDALGCGNLKESKNGLNVYKSYICYDLSISKTLMTLVWLRYNERKTSWGWAVPSSGQAWAS